MWLWFELNLMFSCITKLIFKLELISELMFMIYLFFEVCVGVIVCVCFGWSIDHLLLYMIVYFRLHPVNFISGYGACGHLAHIMIN